MPSFSYVLNNPLKYTDPSGWLINKSKEAAIYINDNGKEIGHSGGFGGGGSPFGAAFGIGTFYSSFAQATAFGGSAYAMNSYSSGYSAGIGQGFGSSFSGRGWSQGSWIPERTSKKDIRSSCNGLIIGTKTTTTGGYYQETFNTGTYTGYNDPMSGAVAAGGNMANYAPMGGGGGNPLSLLINAGNNWIKAGVTANIYSDNIFKFNPERKNAFRHLFGDAKLFLLGYDEELIIKIQKGHEITDGSFGTDQVDIQNNILGNQLGKNLLQLNKVISDIDLVKHTLNFMHTNGFYKKNNINGKAEKFYLYQNDLQNFLNLLKP